MATNNSTILDKIWLSATNDYQQRIPVSTQNGIAATIEALFDPMNNAYYNQFVDALVNRIGMTYVHQQSFKNPLSVFKKSKMLYGSTEQEIAVKWIKGHSYIDDAEDVFKMYRPDAGVWYHTQNREDFYPITVVKPELYRAFTADDGIARFVSAIMQSPINSDEYDEYRIMMQLVAFYEQNFGFFKHHLSGAPTTETYGKEFLTALRTYSRLLKFPSARYNAGLISDLPVFAKPEEMVLLITPDYRAAVEVETLASVFQLDKADINYRIIDVDEFPIPNAVALLTTEDFFRCRDTLYETTSIYNPKTLGNNMFLHHWGIYSVSPFVPAILFTTANGTTLKTVTQTVSGVTMSAASATAHAGDNVKLTVNLTGSLSASDSGSTGVIEVAPDSVVFNTGVTRTQTGRAGVHKFVFSGSWASGKTVTIAGTTITLDSTSAASSNAAAGAMRTALASNTAYTVSGSGANVILTEKSGYYGVGMPAYATNSANGVITATTTTEGISTTAIVNSSRTRVDDYGVLHVAEDLNVGDVITVTGTTTYVNPSNSTSTYTATVTVTVN